jgi:uncharacterized membrane protein
MTNRTFSLIVFLVLCAVLVCHALYYYPQLPGRVASHFGGAGKPNDWSTKGLLVGVYLVTVGITAATLLAIAYATPKLPDSLISLPNKDYWLSPERREETFAALASLLFWFGSATNILLFDMFHQTFRVNLGRTDRLEHPMLAMGIYLAFTAVWSVALILRFARKR